MVRVSDGAAKVCLLASAFDLTSPTTLRWTLARSV
jgi:hypothetical protein